jgi:predicted membrane-bound spermidine synthase
MINYQLVGALLGLGLAIADFLILRSLWKRADVPSDRSGFLKGIVLFGFVFLPILGWIQGGVVFGASR